MSLIIGDAIAISLLKIRKFKLSQFGKLHPGGNIGKDLVKLSDIMHIKNNLPLTKQNEKMSNVLIQMTKKSFGCIGVINSSLNLIGVITDGDLRRNMNRDIITKTASQVMTKNPITIDKNILAAKALSLMNEKKITCLCVTNKNVKDKTVGILHIHNILETNIQ